ncbi:hypothetical protein REMIM1_PE00061 (plasmid) [Rhizobium etli bv. mimosae str. Mim1]|nr:hypothetical protein REMIM1_PE00061 [Rhizobium etli bv. mimosae str. Mim1]
MKRADQIELSDVFRGQQVVCVRGCGQAEVTNNVSGKLEQLLPWNWQPHGVNTQAA